MHRIFFIALAAAAGTAPAGGEPLSDTQWSEDLAQLSSAVKEIHFKPFQVLPEAEFDDAVERLNRRIPALSDAEIVVEMAKIVAALHDGHTRLQIPRLYPELALAAELGHSGTAPPRVDSLKFGQSPARFGLFDDGLFVIDAAPEYRELIGQAVRFFDATPADDAIERVKTVSYFENDSRARLMAPDRLALPEVTRQLGITLASDIVELTTVDRAGKITKSRLKTLEVPGQNFIGGLPSPPPLWLQNTDTSHWYMLLKDRDAIYVQVNRFVENPEVPYSEFVAETITAAHKAGVSRFIIDLRHNFGGSGAGVTPFVTGLGNSEFNTYGRLFILMGRTTFSAAQQFLGDFEEFTDAIFVGEPSGGKPSHFGDSKRVVLANSGLTLRVSTIFWHSWLADDFRDAINPDIPAPLTSDDWFHGRDPALDAALQYQAAPGLAARIDAQFRLGNSQNAVLLYQRYMSDARITNHRLAIPDLLKMADRLVADGLVRPAYFVYLLANQSYPGDPDIESGLERIQDRLE